MWSPLALELMEVLEDVTLHPPARDLCREIGYQAGFESATALDRPRNPPFPKAETFLAMPPSSPAPGSEPANSATTMKGGRVVWTFTRGTVLPETAREKGVGSEPSCAFFEGLGAGWAKGSLGVNLRLSETDCIARGDAACRFQSWLLPG